MRLTTAKEELQWQEFKTHLDWAELFSLIIFFVDDESLVEIFRTRLYHQQQGKVSALNVFQPQTAERLSEEFFLKLETHIIPDVKVPLWLELYQPSQDWDRARDIFFARLNEYRDPLRHKFPYPVIILIPQQYKARLRDIAPDLWSVRSYTDEFLANSVDALAPASVAQETTNLNLHFKSNSSKAVEIIEWQRIQKQTVTDNELFQVGHRAFFVAFNLGDRELAESIVERCLLQIRTQLKKVPDSNEYLRYLSVFLNVNGDLENAQGRREAAYERYQESLKIDRRLRETLGETPETLRDLSISLENMGKSELAQDNKPAAKDYFQECLGLWQRLQGVSPKNKEASEQVNKLKELLKQCA